MIASSRIRRVRRSGCWRPAAAACLVHSAVGRRALQPDDEALRAAAAWLERAQDAAGDGGIAGRYRLAGGWSSSYPETTGYTIPTLLRLAEIFDDDRYRARAARAVDFLLGIQLSSGAFPALEIGDNRTEPSPFNTSQIVHGLHTWLRATNDRRVLDPMLRAASWVSDEQDEDGAWRRHFYKGIACTYSAHAACWLAEVGVELDVARLIASAHRNLQWVLSQRDPDTGWIDRCGFSSADHAARRAPTHTIGYTLSGLLRLSQRLRVAEAFDAVRVAAERLLERLERSRFLPGVVDFRWRPQAEYACLAGNAQLSVLWMDLAGTTGDLRFVNAAFKAIDDVKRTQLLASRDAGIRGGVAGSQPIGGEYLPFAFPNWAAKFFIDALCAKRAWSAAACPRRSSTELETMPIELGATGSDDRARVSSVVVYTTRISPKFAVLAEKWRARGFAPALVVIETGSASPLRRAVAAVRPRADDVVRLCRRLKWRCVIVRSINSADAVEAIRAVDPLVAVHSGAGILRGAILALPRLGTLGAHMGLLPGYRGMNVSEWAALHGDPIGCSVFWLDRGIDTGPVIATRRVALEGCASITDLRKRVDEAQLDELDRVLQMVAGSGSTPRARTQRREDGRSYFRMHDDLRALLERRLRASSLESALQHETHL